MVDTIKALAANAKNIWVYVQDILDVRGDVVLLALSSACIFRIVYAAFGHPGLNVSEAAMYSSAIAAFSYSNVNKPKP